MSTQLGNLIVDIDLNTSKLGSSVTHLQRQMRIVNSAMRANLSGLKENGTESDKLSSKIDSLNKSQKIQQAIVNETEKEYRKLVATKGAGAKETEAYATKLNKEQAKLKEVTAQLSALEREQRILNSGWTKLGNGLTVAGTGLTNFGSGMKNVGGGLTKYVTAPILGATTAVGGLVTAFGWKRLVGIDNARAQLKGLGYDVKDIDRISEQVSSAVNNTTMTMAEGTTVASGALAAGVEEGEELEKYIKRVGNAAAGANRPVGDMAMIFNRVQGSGRAMTEEINMVEDSLPGFSLAMSEHMGVSISEFRKMVSEGKVSSDDFMTVMDGFAGGMAEAYAGTWSGMLSNTQANIGKLGESLLSGVFEQSKESIREFLELLKSDSLRSWASSAGETIGLVFTNIVDKVRTGVQWFTNLSTEGKKLVGLFAGISVAIGPLLTILGSVAIFVGKVTLALAPLTAKIAQAGGLFKALGLAIGTLTNPVGITIGIIAGLATAFTVAYTKSETFRNIVQGLIQRFREFIPTIVSFGQSIYSNFMNLVTPAISAVKNFFMDMFQKVKQFWQSDGQTTMQAFMNAINIIKTVVSFAMPIIQNVITVAFKVALAVIRMVWENIKGVINGGLNVIMGLVRVFSGLFTGNFSKMWQGVKQIFVGSIQVIWNAFQLMFWGRLVRGVGSLVTAFTGSIRSMWTRSVSFIKSLFTDSVRYITNMRNSITTTIRMLNRNVNNIFRAMRDFIVSVFRAIYSRATGSVSSLRTAVSNAFTAMKNNISRIMDSTKKTLKDAFDNMVKGARELPKRIGDGIRNMKDKVKSGIQSLGNSMASTLEKAINKVIGGINSVTKKLGITATISDVSVPRFSTGTVSPSSLVSNGKIAKDTLATVGDKGRGNGAGTRELVQYPNGLTGLYDNDATIFAPKGTIIWNNKQTEQILNGAPKFSTGSGAKNQNTKKNNGLFGTMKDLLANTWDYIKNPKKAFNAIISNVAPNFSNLAGFAGNLIKGGFNIVKEKALEMLTKVFKDNEGGLGNGKASSFMKYAMTTPYSPNSPVAGYPTSFNGGRHYGIDFGTPIGTPVHATLAGKVSKLYNMGGGLVAKLQSGDITQFFMHLSDIVKTGSVQAGDLIAKTGNSGKWTTGPHIHWQAQKGSQVMNSNTIDPRKVLGAGYATGGIIKQAGLYNLAEEGSEVVIPIGDKSRHTDAMKLLAYAGKSLQKNNGNLRPNNLPNINTDNSNDVAELRQLVNNQQQQIQQNNKMIELLANLVAKEPVALYNEKKLAKELEPEITKITKYNTDREARFNR